MNKPAYYVIDVKIRDHEGMKPYQAKVEETIKAYGGKRIVVGGNLEVLEGNGPIGIVVSLQFPNTQKAHAWHESAEYQAIIGHRHASAESHAYIVEGVELATSIE